MKPVGVARFCNLSWLGPCDRSPSGYHWCKHERHDGHYHECRCGEAHHSPAPLGRLARRRDVPIAVRVAYTPTGDYIVRAIGSDRVSSCTKEAFAATYEWLAEQ